VDNLPAGCWESCWLLGELIVDNFLAGCSGRAGCIINNRGDGRQRTTVLGVRS
jgi:hypothetical protein